jgi:MFS family permease
MLPLSAMIATPLFGLMVDRIGKRSLFMAVGTLVLLPLFPIVAYAPAGPQVSFWLPVVGAVTTPMTMLIVMIVLGIVFSLIPAIMWPSVAYLIEEHRLGSAYSAMTFCQPIGMAAIPWLVGMTNDAFKAGPQNPAGYNPGLWIFTGLAAMGLVFSFLLWRTERGPRAHGLETITTASKAS